jgi:hypothetical protein
LGSGLTMAKLGVKRAARASSVSVGNRIITAI